MALFSRSVPSNLRRSDYKTSFISMAVLLCCTVSNAHASVPDYIGPFKYGAPGYPNAAQPSLEGWLATVVNKLNQDPSRLINNCNHFLEYAAPSINWYPYTQVDGIEAYGETSWQIRGYVVRNGVCTGTLDDVSLGSASVGRWRAVCSVSEGTRYFAPADECRPGRYEDQPGWHGSNVGPQCPSCDVGEPITPSTGNMWHAIVDYQAPKSGSELTLSRIYNSSPIYPDPRKIRGFGVRWTHSYDKQIKAERKDLEAKPGQCWRFNTGELECSNGFPSAEAIPSNVSIMYADGKSIPFTRNGMGNYTSSASVNDRLQAVMVPGDASVQEWVLTDAKRGNVERFDKTGVLLSVTSQSGLHQSLTYSDGKSNDTAISRFPATAPACASTHPGVLLPAGRLLCVTNHWGRQLQFRYDEKGRVTELIDPAHQSYLYEYDGMSGGCVPGNEKTLACKANNLTKVTYPDGKSQIYSYNEVEKINGGAPCTGLQGTIGNGFGPTSFVNLMTGLVDENEERYITWTYDCAGKATSSQLGELVNKVELAYSGSGNTSTTVTHLVGPQDKPQTSARTYTNTYVLGTAKPVAINAPCVGCGSIAERAYDSIGNVTKTRDFNSNYSCFAYDTSRNLETARVEGVAGADCAPLLNAQTLALPVRKTTTKWHAQFRLPEVIAEPKRMTKYKYDASGNLISKTEQATTDLTGASGLTAPVTGVARTVTYTYNSVGQLKTVTGPRTDIVDRTSYDYDPATGDLIKVTNAANQSTTFSDYDAHGHARTIRAPNGVTTTLSYTPRGWVASQAVSNGTSTQTTTYDYTPSGQVKTVTLPDNSVTTYSYDVAQRLTSISNNRGESIIYTLDLTGNRIKEEVRDPNGNLARQIIRTYDITGRLTSQTGAAQ